LIQRPTSLVDTSPPGEGSKRPVVLFVATRWELAALRRALPVDRRVEINGLSCFIGQQAERSYWLVRTGIGPEAATAAATLVLSRQPMALAISIGFAGSLVPAAVGDVIVGTSVASGVLNGTWKQSAETIVCDAAAISTVRSIVTQMGMPVRIGSIVSLSTVVCRASEKQLIGRTAGAVALDMESAALGKAAKKQAIPFMVFRTVSDLVDEDLPLDFNLFLRPTGWLKGIALLMSHPSSLIGLNRLRWQSRLAAERLTRVCSAYAKAGFGLLPVGDSKGT
jgi:adenosylhomocysteine nucleosidase